MPSIVKSVGSDAPTIPVMETVWAAPTVNLIADAATADWKGEASRNPAAITSSNSNVAFCANAFSVGYNSAAAITPSYERSAAFSLCLSIKPPIAGTAIAAIIPKITITAYNSTKVTPFLLFNVWIIFFSPFFCFYLYHNTVFFELK